MIGDQNLKDHYKNIKQIDTFLRFVGLGLNRDAHKNPFFLFCVVQSGVWVFIMGFCMCYQPSEFFIKVQQFWGLVIMNQVIMKGINWKIRGDQIEGLLKWFDSIYARKFKATYQNLLDKHLKTQNSQIQVGLFFFKVTTLTAGFFYVAEPKIMQSGNLPTPLYWNGVSDDQLPWQLFYLLWFLYAVNSVIVCSYVISFEQFYTVCMVILGHRFSFILEVLQLLNYDGERDRGKDQKTLRDAYFLHLEVTE